MSTQDVRMTRQAMGPAVQADMVNIVSANAMSYSTVSLKTARIAFYKNRCITKEAW